MQYQCNMCSYMWICIFCLWCSTTGKTNCLRVDFSLFKTHFPERHLEESNIWKLDISFIFFSSSGWYLSCLFVVFVFFFFLVSGCTFSKIQPRYTCSMRILPPVTGSHLTSWGVQWSIKQKRIFSSLHSYTRVIINHVWIVIQFDSMLLLITGYVPLPKSATRSTRFLLYKHN